MTPEEVAGITHIDLFFISKIKGVIDICQDIQKEWQEGKGISMKRLREAKERGCCDQTLAELTDTSEESIRQLRKSLGIEPVYRRVDTWAGNVESAMPYYYSSYEGEDEGEAGKGRKVIVLGSGPIRIGQGVEFDYCSVHSVWALKEMGVEAIIINNNPETVSTDFDTSDRLYFEPLFPEDVLNILEKKNRRCHRPV